MDKPDSIWDKLKGDSDAKQLKEHMDSVTEKVMKSGLLSQVMGVDFQKIKNTVGAESHVAAIKEIAGLAKALDDIQTTMKVVHGIYELKKKQEDNNKKA
eukprot:9038485-Pyramimonas_sp.AAC.1